VSCDVWREIDQWWFWAAIFVVPLLVGAGARYVLWRIWGR
jgi:hypothetical protein